MLDTLTQPEFEEPDKKYTATDMDDAPGCIEIVTQPLRLTEAGSPISWGIVLYVRPIKKSFLEIVPEDTIAGVPYAHKRDSQILEFKNFNAEEIKDAILEESRSRYKRSVCEICTFDEDIFRIKSDINKEFEGLAKYVHEELGNL